MGLDNLKSVIGLSADMSVIDSTLANSPTQLLREFFDPGLKMLNAELEYLPKEQERSFHVKYIDDSYYATSWHYHPEYELVLTIESAGKRFICDKINDFKPGDLALIGPLMPHVYRNDPEYFEAGSSLRAKAIVVHFSKSFLGENFSHVPEATNLQCLLEKASRGLNIIGETNKIVSRKLYELLELNGFAQWLKFLEILNTIAESNEYTCISTNAVAGKNEFESDRLNKVIDFVMKNFSEDIYISEAASLINMAENSFSRYFSKRTGKTFASFVTEIRLTHACKLLIDNTINISEIGFKCGFNNLSNFNRQFSRMYQLSPLAYRKQYWNSI